MKRCFFRYILEFIIIMCFAAVCVSSSIAEPAAQAEETSMPDDELIVSLYFTRQTGFASNQFAVWVEDMDGELIKTLYATSYTADGGYVRRPESIQEWVEKAGLADQTKEQVDAYSGATPKTGELTFSWDLTDESGQPIDKDMFVVLCIEGSLRYHNRVIYSGRVFLGAGESMFRVETEYFFEESEDLLTLTEDAPETAMISNVTLTYYP